MNRMSLVVGTLPFLPHSVVSRSPLTFPDTPEAGPGVTINTPVSSAIPSSPVSVSAHSPTATSSPSSKSRGSSSNVGAVAGGIVGGVVAISAAAFIGFFLRRRRNHQQGLPTAAAFDIVPQPLVDEVRPQSSGGGAFVPPSLPETRAPPMRLYVRISMSLFCRRPVHVLVLPSFLYVQDPNDPNTLSWNQETISVRKAHTQVSETSNIGDTLTNMPLATSPPPTYCGFPAV